jgi:maleate isomerase
MTNLNRIGLMVPSSNVTIETELPALLRSREDVRPEERFTIHSARLRMRHVTAEELLAMNAQTDRAAGELADLAPDVVATGCLVAIMAQGPGYHETAEGQITARLEQEGAGATPVVSSAGAGATPVVSSAGALVAALQTLGARRIGLITPYEPPLTQRVVEYLEDAGVQVGDALSLAVPDNRAVAALDPSDLERHWRRLDLAGCDALVLSACVQMPSLAAIDAVERACGLPTLSAATATAWALLRALGLETVAPGGGALLR